MAPIVMVIAMVWILFADLSNALGNVIHAEANLINAAKAYVIQEEAKLNMVKR